MIWLGIYTPKTRLGLILYWNGSGFDLTQCTFHLQTGVVNWYCICPLGRSGMLGGIRPAFHGTLRLKRWWLARQPTGLSPITWRVSDTSVILQEGGRPKISLACCFALEINADAMFYSCMYVLSCTYPRNLTLCMCHALSILLVLIGAPNCT